jgi:predicted secreted protein
MRFSLLTCLALSWLTATGAAEPTPLAVTVGQEFKLTLQYNSGTGYQWALAKPLDAKLLKHAGIEYKRPEPKLPGGPGDMVWTFKALAEGKADIALNYVRPWASGEKPAQTTNFVVVIQPKPLPPTPPASPPGS